jgi:hypothetical protein
MTDTPTTDGDSGKNLPYYHVLDGLKRADQCPLCTLESESLRRYVDAFLYEGVNDPGIRAGLILSKGYCARHAELLLSFRNGLGTAILYRDQVRIFLRLLESLAGASPRGAAREVSAYVLHAECPLCRHEQELRRHYAATLAEDLGHEVMRGAFQSSPGLCVFHFLLALGTTESEKACRFLIETERQECRDLLHDLGEFCGKHDYRYTHEGFSKEADSWARAARMIAGRDDPPGSAQK